MKEPGITSRSNELNCFKDNDKDIIAMFLALLLIVQKKNPAQKERNVRKFLMIF